MCARTAVCGHSYCDECITESLLRSKQCPNCRKDIRKWSLQRSEQIDYAVAMLAESIKLKQGAQAEAYVRYQERLANYAKWLEKHRVPLVKAGQKLDVLDTEHIWCNAAVELKIQVQNQEQPLLLVHYHGWSRKYDEFLMMDSKRIAPPGLYTGRDDIPRYRMALNNNIPLNVATVIQNPNQELREQQQRQAQNAGDADQPDSEEHSE